MNNDMALAALNTRLSDLALIVTELPANLPIPSELRVNGVGAPAREKVWIRLYEEGFTFRQIRGITGGRRETMSNILKQAGVAVYGLGRPHRTQEGSDAARTARTARTATTTPEQDDATQRAWIVEYSAGCTAASVARRHGVRPETVADAVRSAGGRTRTQPAAPTDIDAMVGLLSQRFTIGEISVHTGFSFNTVQRHLAIRGADVPLGRPRTR